MVHGVSQYTGRPYYEEVDRHRHWRGGGNGTGGKQQEEARVDEYIVVMMKNTRDACQVKALHCRHWCTTKTKIKSRKYTCRHWIR